MLSVSEIMIRVRFREYIYIYIYMMCYWRFPGLLSVRKQRGDGVLLSANRLSASKSTHSIVGSRTWFDPILKQRGDGFLLFALHHVGSQLLSKMSPFSNLPV